MIISASRRTDIPAFFSDWFFKRIEEKYVYVRNPMNVHQVSEIDLSPDVIDCIVFWSKNPKPMLDKLDGLKDYMYYFQFTLNPYHTDIEQKLPALGNRLDTFKRLSEAIGKHRVIWRYDPILLTDKYSAQWHMEQFAYIASALSAYTEKCTISFIDMYPGIYRNMRSMGIHEIDSKEKRYLAKMLASIADSCGLALDACAEKLKLSEFGIGRAHCIDGALISRLLDCPINTGKDKNQRPACGCSASIDIGFYNTCQNECLYCYANHNVCIRKRNFKNYDIDSPLLCSNITEEDKVTHRKVESQKELQTSLFCM